MPETIIHISNERLNEYLDGAFPSPLISEIELHLTTCTECAARAHSLRMLFSTLNELPEWPLRRDFSKTVIKALQPEIILPRTWKWAVAGQFILATILLAVSLPTLFPLDWLSALHGHSNALLDPIFEIGLYFSQLTQTFNQTLSQWISELHPPQLPTLPFSLSVLTPILITTGLLWIVGNGLLLKKQT